MVLGTRNWFVRTRRALVSVTFIGGVVVLAGAQPAAAVSCPVPIAPNAVDQTYSVSFGEQLKVAEPGLLTGATGTSIAVETSWQATDQGFPSDDVSANGAIINYVAGSGTPSRLGGFTYTPDPDLDPFSGVDNFLFTATNPCGDESYAEADITVVPTVVDASYTAVMDHPLTVPAASGFLANDKGIDPESLQYDTTSAHGGGVDDGLNSDGSFVYTPPAGFTGADSFTYTVSDINQNLTYGPKTVHINVVGPPAAPTGVHASASGTSATVSWNAPSAHGKPITGYTVVTAPGAKTVTTSSRSAKVQGLKPHTTYTFKVRAKNSVGTGPWSKASNAVTIVQAQSTPRAGYWMVASNGKTYGFGVAIASSSSASSAVAIAGRRDGGGYWTVDRTGRVSQFGGAASHGGSPTLRAGEVVSTISATPTGNGYWLFTNRGRSFAYGDAKFLGDMSGQALNGPVIASVATPTGHGYYMVGSDGGVFSFGDARFHGSTGGIHLNKPIVGISPSPDNKGYWLVASDGGVFAFSAPFRGSMGGMHLAQPVNGLVAYGNGYLMVASDGGVFTFSNKAFLGSLASHPPAAPIIGIAAFATS